ncbi:methyl-accepting chemotaxis protein [Campylobacter fetus subsp. fetus]|nr:chemotaxis protein [Campylobacter fetus]SQH29538.1 methyl-accepting chemotaxis protein [Campylobacter fetus subsp. fetus]
MKSINTKVIAIIAILMAMLIALFVTVEIFISKVNLSFKEINSISDRQELLYKNIINGERAGLTVRQLYIDINDKDALDILEATMKDFEVVRNKYRELSGGPANAANQSDKLLFIQNDILQGAKKGEKVTITDLEDLTPTWRSYRSVLEKRLEKLGEENLKANNNFASDISVLTIGFTVFIITIIILSSLILLISKSYLLKAIKSIESGLKDFFDFLNHKNDNPKAISLKSNDEFGVMASLINSNISSIKESLDKDAKAVEEALVRASEVEKGNLGARIMHEPDSPGLKKLKDVLNSMLNTLQGKIGSDINVIQKTFDDFKNLDFTSNIPNAKGEVEKVTNLLGNEITKMLKDNLNQANNLKEKANSLKEYVTTLNDSARSQANSTSRKRSSR